MHIQKTLLPGLIALTLAGCGDVAGLSVSEGMGPQPNLPAPKAQKIPTVNVAKAIGWPKDAKPVAVEGTNVVAFARDLDHPRWLYELPNGDILVAETNSPPKPEGSGFSLRGWLAGKFMAKAGAGVPSPNQIILLRDTDGDGQADERSVFLKELHSPFGMALVGDTFYVANADAVVKFPYQQGQKEITESPTKLVDLPAGINHHWTKNLIPNKDGSKLYVTVGSNSNVGENGMDIEEGRAAIWEVDTATGQHSIYASGLRNPNGLAWEPGTNTLFTVVNERDEIGSDLVPDYLTSVQQGAFYGWPYSYYGQHVDERVQPQQPELVAKAIAPDYALGPHTASLGLTMANGNKLGAQFASGVFIGQHGSWNRDPRSGYKVIFVPFSEGKPLGNSVDVLTGFLTQQGEAQGRPVGVIVDKQGALLVADDVGNVIWRVSGNAQTVSASVQ